MTTEIEKTFSIAGDAVWTEVVPGNRRAVLSQRPELMLVAFSFEKGAVGALHSHPHTQVSYVAEGSFDVTVDGVTTRLSAGASYIVAPKPRARRCGPGEGPADRHLHARPRRFYVLMVLSFAPWSSPALSRGSTRPPKLNGM